MSKLKSQSSKLKDLKVAIAVEELTQLGGAERVLDALLEVFPAATIYTLVWDKEKTQHRYDNLVVKTSFIQKMPFGVKRYKWYLPLMPMAIESFNFSGFDLVISSASALIKGVNTSPKQLHICYCHTPTRYLWLDYQAYLRNAPIPFFVRPFMPIILWFLRRWDLKASQKPDYYLTNSSNVQKRIKKYYHRSSTIIYPPINWRQFRISRNLENYFLLVSRIEPYKKVDLVVKVFNRLGLNLKIAGSGTKKNELEKNSKPNIEFLGRLSDVNLARVYSHAKALIFPQIEDFGIVAVESMAAGRPVLAYRGGGALETVVEGKTGEFFYPQNSITLQKSIKSFNFKKYNPYQIRLYAKKFDKSLFKKLVLEYIIDKLKVKKT